MGKGNRNAVMSRLSYSPNPLSTMERGNRRTETRWCRAVHPQAPFPQWKGGTEERLGLRVFQVRAGCVEELHAGDAARGFVVEQDRHHAVECDYRPERARADRRERCR